MCIRDRDTLQLSQSCMVTRMPAMIISIISASLAMMLSWKLSGVSGRESCSWAATQLAKHPTSCLLYPSDYSVIRQRKVYQMKDGWLEQPIDVGVDSGQAGFYDEAFYQDNSIFKGMPEMCIRDSHESGGLQCA